MRIVLDTSAVIAILQQEPEGVALRDTWSRADAVFISAMTLFELRVVLLRRGGVPQLIEADTLLREGATQVVPFDERMAGQAADAYARYGKGIHPRARLNLADCAAYALAKSLDATLLFKGGDFAETDVARALG
ncbi:MAG: type II toxin-antitoxin system VapC family toxin [Acetobacteraceae bacterium]|nr:type II toxin-antitoxin system VapC family toxin [Acetobacteraceae bacterium]